MPEARGTGKLNATVSAKVIRADGTIENLGVIAETGANSKGRWFQSLVRSLFRLAKSG